MSAPEDQRITQVMSLSRDEFAMSMAAFLGTAAPTASDTHTVAAGGGTVVISYRALPGVRLGGLLALPRAEVSLDFAGLGAADKTAFLRRFEIAFQRGGG